MIERLDHINIRTARLDAMIEWYERVLGLVNGFRPPFHDNGGAWMYAGEYPVVHLVRVEQTPQDGTDLRLEHGAFRASDFAGFISRLEEAGERYEKFKVPGVPILQVNVWDPDGNHLHIDFSTEAEEGVA